MNPGRPAKLVLDEALSIRTAAAADIPALHALIEASVRELQAADYSPEQLEGALGTYLGVDTQLIEDGTYFVVETSALLVACGGWSRRKTLFGADHRPGRDETLLEPKSDAAKIRAFFVHPDGRGGVLAASFSNTVRTRHVRRGLPASRWERRLPASLFIADGGIRKSKGSSCRW